MIGIGSSAKGILLPKIAAYGIIGGGFGVILMVGLLSGLVGRPNNCIKPSTTTTTKLTTTTTKPQITTATTSSATTSTRKTSTTTKPSTTTRTSRTTSTTKPSTTTRTSRTTSTKKPSTTTSTSKTTSTTKPITTSTSTTTTTKPTTTTSITSSSTSTTSKTSITSTTSSTSTTTTSKTTQAMPTKTLPTLPTSPTTPASTTTTKPAEIRLPKYAKPSLYELYLRVSFDPYQTEQSSAQSIEDRYEGKVTIFFDLEENTDTIKLHSAVQIDKIVLTSLNNNEAIQTNDLEGLPYQIMSIKTQKELEKGEYKLEIEFKNGLTSLLYGFYKSKYSEDGKIK
jgi:hypothetical protein